MAFDSGNYLGIIFKNRNLMTSALSTVIYLEQSTNLFGTEKILIKINYKLLEKHFSCNFKKQLIHNFFILLFF